MNKNFGHHQDGHLTLLVQFPLPVLQVALLVTEICWFGNEHIHEFVHIILYMENKFYVYKLM